MIRHSIMVLGIAALCLTGCEVIIDDGEWPQEPQTEYPGDSSVIREIDAISRLSFESDKHAGYERIAERREIGDAVIVHLIEAVYETMSFESSQLDLLLRIIEGPNFRPAAKEAILDRLDQLKFQSSKSRILEAISDRGI